jgi:hypothetical protein
MWYSCYMCKICGLGLTPIVYGQLNPVILEMSKTGRVIIGDDDAIDRPLFYCSNCTEAF